MTTAGGWENLWLIRRTEKGFACSRSHPRIRFRRGKLSCLPARPLQSTRSPRRVCPVRGNRPLLPGGSQYHSAHSQWSVTGNESYDFFELSPSYPVALIWILYLRKFVAVICRLLVAPPRYLSEFPDVTSCEVMLQ